MSAASVKVAVRVRPMAAKELLSNSSDCVEIIPGTSQIIIGGGPSNNVGTDSIYSFSQKSFTFDYLFDDNSTQSGLYECCVSPLVDKFLLGFNATILAYGQTGSGKTYTMGIGLDSIDTMDMTSQGIVPRAISTIFKMLESEKLKNEEFESKVTVSFMELYNEELVDLLNHRPRSASNQCGPVIREDSHGKIVWQNLWEEKVTSTKELLDVLQKGSLCRTTGSTDMNASSSRSHAIFTVTLKQTKNDGEGSKTNLISRFHFVDLAGSERLKRTNAEGDRKKEGISINQGLLALGNVISALGDEARKGGHVPYRDSKLTRMLQDSLGGNSQTLMLACISPSDLNYGETVNTLHYANRARNIKNSVEINQDWGSGYNADAMREIKTLRSTISQLRTEIAMIRQSGVISSAEREDLVEINPFMEQSQLLYHQRRERDQSSEIELLKSKLACQEFLMDQYQFTCFRLRDRVRLLMNENGELITQRDTCLADKCKLLKEHINCANLLNFIQADDEIKLEGTEFHTKKKRKSRESSPDNFKEGKRSSSPSFHGEETADNIGLLIKKYVETIAKLRIQLSESEDRLAWQYEAMSQLGKKGAKPRVAWDEQQLAGLDINTNPTNNLVEGVKDTKNQNSLVRQRKILEAIRENIEIRDGKDYNTNFQIDLNSNIAQLEENSEFKESALKFQFSGDSTDIDDEDSTGNQETNDKSNLFLLINSIQNDIQSHESLIERNQKREAEYEKMQKAYEQKLTVLQNQMERIQEERDLALKKISKGPKNNDENARHYEEAKLRLVNEISDTRRKMGENSRMRSNNKARNDKLTSELQATIAALKEEKNRMLQNLRIQTQKYNDKNVENQREIANLKRKEKNASDIVRKLERSNQLQKLMLKKRNEEVIKSKNQLKKVIVGLKRAPTPNKVSKSGYISPISKKSRGLRGANMNELLASVNSPVRVSVSESLMDMRSEDIDIRAQFKKQMVDKELQATIASRKTQKTLEKLQKCRNKLIDEQKELIAERKRVVEANYQATGVYDVKVPQYMDERVKSIDVEVASLDSSMTKLEAKIKQNFGTINENQISTIVDLSWDNALNLVRSLNRMELEATVQYFLEDVVQLRISEDEYQQELDDKESSIESLRLKLLDIQESFNSKLSLIEKPLEPMKKDLAKSLGEFPFPRKLPVLEERSKSALDNTMSIDQIQDTLQIPTASRMSPIRTVSPIRPMSISPEAEVNPFSLRSRLLQKRENQNLVPIEKKEKPSILSRVDEDDDKKKRFDLLNLGGAVDVFKRLANSHTQASQAKVIHRSQVDREAAMENVGVNEDKRKSLSELEQAWNFETT